MRVWIKDHPVKESRLQEGSVVKAILDREPKYKISFELHPNANPPSRKQGLLRWQINPEPFWGPRPRARVKEADKTCTDAKKEKNKKRKREKVSKSFFFFFSVSICLTSLFFPQFESFFLDHLDTKQF